MVVEYVLAFMNVFIGALQPVKFHRCKVVGCYLEINLRLILASYRSEHILALVLHTFHLSEVAWV